LALARCHGVGAFALTTSLVMPHQARRAGERIVVVLIGLAGAGDAEMVSASAPPPDVRKSA